MAPSRSPNYLINGRRADLEGGSEILSLGTKSAEGANVNDVVFGEDSHGVHGAPLAATLSNHVTHVGGLVAKEHVARVYAGRRVASMANELAVRYASVCQFPGDAMGIKALPVDSYAPVPGFATSACPHPAVISLSYPWPESFFNGAFVAHPDTLSQREV